MGDRNPITAERRTEIAEHARRYIATGGAEGRVVNGREHLVLTTTGRRSGAARHAPLVYARDGDALLVAGSVGGYDKHPQWYLNLAAEPTVTVQLGAERFDARARTAGADERPRLFGLMTEALPELVGYQEDADREIPIVVLERVSP